MTFDTATSTTLQVQREAFYCPYELLFKKYCYIIIHATICGKGIFEYVNVSLASTICSLIGEVTIASINGDFIREVMVTSINATFCLLILVTLIIVNFL